MARARRRRVWIVRSSKVFTLAWACNVAKRLLKRVRFDKSDLARAERLLARRVIEHGPKRTLQRYKDYRRRVAKAMRTKGVRT